MAVGLPTILALRLGTIDALVVVGYLAFTTWLGARLAGRAATMRDFFLGGRRLPWYAVAGSIVATEISAVTFIGLPYVVFRAGGDFTYAQLGLIGSLLARVVVAFWFVPAYYEKGIYSPYDFMGRRLGEGARRVATGLFSLGGLLAQSARVYLTAIVLELVLHDPVFAPLERATGVPSLGWAVALLGAVAVVWTLLGGIATVVWTDVVLFCVFLVGAATAVAVVLADLGQGPGSLFADALDAGKLRFFNFSSDPTSPYTLWAALFGASVGMVAAYGTDQLMAQRAFCCHGPREARRAVIASLAGQVVTLLVMVVGLGLWAFYREHPLAGERLALFTEKPDRIFPIFVLDHVPAGLTGLIVAGVLAAAISSLDSILAALAQTTLSAAIAPWLRRRARRRGAPEPDERSLVRAGRIAIVFWGALLCLTALLAEKAARHYPSLLDLALAMAGYTGGALLAGFLLALAGRRGDAGGYLFAAPLSVLAVFAAVWDAPWARGLLWAALAAWAGAFLLHAWSRGGVGVPRLAAALAGATLVLLVQRHLRFERVVDGVPVRLPISWPWYVPLGAAVALSFSRLLASPAANDEERSP